MSIIILPNKYPVTCHTDHVGPGSVFVAIKGIKEDGSNYIPEAIARGATSIVIQEGATLVPEVQKLLQEKAIKVISVNNTREALAMLSAQVLQNPAKSLRIIGVTGTKGKTTTVFLVEHLLKTAGFRTAMLSTVKNRILDTEFKTELTTQQPDYLHIFLDTCRKYVIDYVVMEVAAQALSLYRVAGIEFDGLIFTNFSLEHAEFYDTVESYFAAKVSILSQVKLGAPLLLSSDNAQVSALSKNLPDAVLFGVHNSVGIKARVKKSDLTGIEADIETETECYSITAPALVGMFNIYNMLGAMGLAQALGVESAIIQKAIRSFIGVPGRLEKFILANGSTAFIDYAHNASSYEAVLSTLRVLSPHLIVIFGAGGERDITKRPIMGRIAAEYADRVILTSDNPRSEDPLDIIKDIQTGINPKYSTKITVELDREIAIRKAYAVSNSESMIILLGKGPSEYQLIKGIKIPFSETAILRSLQKNIIMDTL